MFLLFARNLSNKYEKQKLNTASKTGLEPVKAASTKYSCKKENYVLQHLNLTFVITTMHKFQ